MMATAGGRSKRPRRPEGFSADAKLASSTVASPAAVEELPRGFTALRRTLRRAGARPGMRHWLALRLWLEARAGPQAKYLTLAGRGDGGAGRFRSRANIFLANSHQNSHSPKIKMAADLAASHLIDFIGFLAPQVGLEPTTLRLTAECSAIELLRSVLPLKFLY